MIHLMDLKITLSLLSSSVEDVHVPIHLWSTTLHFYNLVFYIASHMWGSEVLVVLKTFHSKNTLSVFSQEIIIKQKKVEKLDWIFSQSDFRQSTVESKTKVISDTAFVLNLDLYCACVNADVWLGFTHFVTVKINFTDKKNKDICYFKPSLSHMQDGEFWHLCEFQTQQSWFLQCLLQLAGWCDWDECYCQLKDFYSARNLMISVFLTIIVNRVFNTPQDLTHISL